MKSKRPVLHVRGGPWYMYRAGLNIIVEDVFEEFLTAGLEFGFAVLEDIGFELVEVHLAGSNLLAECGVPACVAFLDGLFEDLVLEEFGGDLKAACEGIHRADVGIEKVHVIDGLASDMGVEVEAAGGKSARLQDGVHGHRGVVKVCRELVGVPAEQQVAAVGVHGAEDAVDGGKFQFVMEGMSGQGRMVGFDVHFEMGQEAVLLEESKAVARVEVVLVLGWLFGFGFDVELAFEADFLFVIDGKLEEQSHVVQLAFHIGIEKGVIAFASAPEDVAGAAEFLGQFHRLFDLAGGVGEDVGVGVCARPGHKARVREGVGGTPEALDAGVFLELFGDGDDLIEAFVGFGQVVSFGGDVAVMEAPELDAQFGEKFKGGLHSLLGPLHRVGGFIVAAEDGVGAELVGSKAFEGVPVTDGKAQVFGHRLAQYFLFGVVMLEGKRIFGISAFVLYLFDFRKELSHNDLLYNVHIDGL